MATRQQSRPALHLENGAWRLLFVGLSIVLLAIGAWSLWLTRAQVSDALGWDIGVYLNATNRWLAGGPFYEPYQLAGAYTPSVNEILYPPVVLWLLVPFTRLPLVLWWVVPIGVTAWVVWRLRPAAWVWPVLALLIVWPSTLTSVVSGNPGMWAVMALALGVVTVGPAVFVFVKPTLAPFALWGIRHRRWWLYLAVLGILCIPFGEMWVDWFTVTRNAQSTVLYSLNQVPMMLIPVVAWLASRPAQR